MPRVAELLAADQIGKYREEVTHTPAPEYCAAFDAIEADPRTQLLVVEMQGRVVRTLQLTTDLRREDAHRFYESLGFVHGHAGMKLSLDLE